MFHSYTFMVVTILCSRTRFDYKILIMNTSPPKFFNNNMIILPKQNSLTTWFYFVITLKSVSFH